MLRKPLLTEKTLNETSLNRFTFEVDKKANKGQIREAVEAAFDVEVVSVRTLRNAGSLRKTGKRRLPSKVPGIKKAIVELKQGQTIKAFETKG